jgi:hypothetical protein
MNTIAEIEDAVATLGEQERAELMEHISLSLQLRVSIPEPRIFSKEEVDAWVEEDERGMRELEEKWPDLKRRT